MYIFCIFNVYINIRHSNNMLNTLKRRQLMNAYTIYTGYTADDLNAMYMEARSMMMACMYASDKSNAMKWKRIAIDCAVTLHAMQNGHTI